MDNDVLVSVLMPIYNGEKYLVEAIDSILKQTYKEFEFIIIDDGSTDKSYDIVKNYEDKRIKLIRNETNIQLVDTLNKGVSLSKGRYIARMDCDDIAHTERLEKQLRLIEKNNDVAVVGASIQLINEYGKKGRKYFYPEDSDYLSWCLLYFSPIAHPAAMIRKTMLEGVGGYNKLMTHAEDHYLWYRLSQVGKIINVNDVLMYIRKHQDNVTKKNVRENVEKSIFVSKVVSKKIYGIEIDKKVMECIRLKVCGKYSYIKQAIKYVGDLYDSFAAGHKNKYDSIEYIKKDAALRISTLILRRIYDFRLWPSMYYSLRINKLVFFDLIKLIVEILVLRKGNTRCY